MRMATIGCDWRWPTMYDPDCECRGDGTCWNAVGLPCLNFIKPKGHPGPHFDVRLTEDEVTDDGD